METYQSKAYQVRLFQNEFVGGVIAGQIEVPFSRNGGTLCYMQVLFLAMVDYSLIAELQSSAKFNAFNADFKS